MSAVIDVALNKYTSIGTVSMYDVLYAPCVIIGMMIADERSQAFARLR